MLSEGLGSFEMPSHPPLKGRWGLRWPFNGVILRNACRIFPGRHFTVLTWHSKRGIYFAAVVRYFICFCASFFQKIVYFRWGPLRASHHTGGGAARRAGHSRRRAFGWGIIFASLRVIWRKLNELFSFVIRTLLQAGRVAPRAGIKKPSRCIT